MLKRSGPSIIKPLLIIFRNCLKFGTFSDDRRVTLFRYIRKIINKLSTIIALYRCFLYAPNFFEKLVFYAISEFMMENNLLNRTQSGFKPNDPCINQPISITFSIFSAFDAYPSLEVRGVFLDLSKAFDRVWYEGLLRKLMNSGINSNLLF